MGVWRQRLFLAGMGMVAGPMMRAGKVRLEGLTPNGQRFVANPLLLWLVADSEATLDGVDLGAVGSSPTPGRLEDFWIPQRGVFAIGKAFFTTAQADDADAEQRVESPSSAESARGQEHDLARGDPVHGRAWVPKPGGTG
jgi:hypothetical protein